MGQEITIFKLVRIVNSTKFKAQREFKILKIVELRGATISLNAR